MSSTTHPQQDDHGQKVIIKEPTTPTPLSTWNDPSAIATVVPGGSMPAELNGVAFTPWANYPTTAAEWNSYEGLAPAIREPAMTVPAGMQPAAGAIVLEADGRVWVVHPSNGWGGYQATWAKGRVEGGLSLQATAVREVFEESGLQVRIVGFWGDYDRTTTRTRYYLAERIGGHPGAGMTWESQAVSLCPVSDLPKLLNGAADMPIIATLQAASGRA